MKGHVSRRTERTSIGADREAETTIKQRKTDGNVVLIPLRILGDEPRLVTGDPIKCGSCSAVLTSTAVLKTEGETKIWECEFCGNKNSGLDISENEIPKGDSFDFMLSPATKPIEKTDNTAAENAIEKKKKASVGVTVYCMDISGSMDEMCQIPESHVAWSEERTHGASSASTITKLNCIKKAIQRLIEQLKEEEPNKQVLLTVFGSDVYVKGGGNTENLPSFHGLQNKSFSELLQMGLSNDYPLKSIEESHQSLDTAVQTLGTQGCTALGPALSLCAGYVSEKPGSEIVLCTDGLPNVGIGSLQPGQNGAEFYRMIGEYARSKNITINILAVGGDSMELRSVSAAAEISGGLTNRLNPVEIVRQLRLIAQNEIIAMSVSVRFYLHPDFIFDETGFGENLSRLEKEVGNVRKETDLSFRFKLRDPQKKKSLSSVPFQVQINYTRPDGMSCLRVLSKSAQATSSRKKMEENINVSVVGVAVMKSTARMAQSGKPTEAQHLLKNVKRLVKRGANSDEQREERLAFMNGAMEWDSKLTEEHSKFSENYLQDSVYCDIQQAYSTTSHQLVSVQKKMADVRSQAMSDVARARYYQYTSDL